MRQELAEIYTIFKGIDPNLDVVAGIAARLERRITAALRYMDHHDPARIERTASALRVVGAASELDGAPQPPLALWRLPIGPPHLYVARTPKKPIVVVPLPEVRPGPAVEAFVAAKDVFRLRTTVTLEHLSAFLGSLLHERALIQGSQIELTDVDDFVAFQRLREIDMLFGRQLSRRYRLTRVEGRVANGWLDCPDFLIERKSVAARGTRCLKRSAPLLMARSHPRPARGPRARTN